MPPDLARLPRRTCGETSRALSSIARLKARCRLRRQLPWLVVASAAAWGLPAAWASPRTGGVGTPIVNFRGCPQVIFYSARGSGEKRTSTTEWGLGAPGFELYAQLVSDSHGGALFNAGSEGDGYAAVSVPSATLNALAHGLQAVRYRRSVQGGIVEGVNDVTSIATRCPGSSIVLSGYSQGAEVIRGVMAQLRASVETRVAAVELFGDPFFDAREANVHTDGGFKPSQVGVRLQLGGQRVRFGRRWAAGNYSWCHAHDVVCQGIHGFQNGFRTHSTYRCHQDVFAAAAQVEARLTQLGVTPPLTDREPTYELTC